MTTQLHHHDLPDNIEFGNSVAIDTETMGLQPHRDRLCLVQLRGENSDVHLVKIAYDKQPAPNLVKLIKDPDILKIFHFGRFDIAVLAHTFQAVCRPVYCTKIASRLVRTYTDRHGLKNLVSELLGVDISKHQQMSDWGADTLTEAQQSYAASDVLYLHQLRSELNQRLERENRLDIAQACFNFLPDRALLDLAGWPETDIFSHS